MTTPIRPEHRARLPPHRARRELKKAVEAYWAGTLDRRRAARPPPAGAARRRAGGRCATPDSTRSRPTRSRTTTTCSTPRSLRRRGARPVRAARPVGDLDTLLRDGPRRRDDAPLRDDQVVRHQLPLPGPGDRRRTPSSRSTRHKPLARVRRGACAGLRTRPGARRPGHVPAAGQGAPDGPAGFVPLDRLDDLLAVYAELLGALAAAGVGWVQLDEPALRRPTARRRSIAAVADRATSGSAAARRPAAAVRRGLLRRPRRRAAGARWTRRSRRSAWTWSRGPGSRTGSPQPALCAARPRRRRGRRPQHLAHRPASAALATLPTRARTRPTHVAVSHLLLAAARPARPDRRDRTSTRSCSAARVRRAEGREVVKLAGCWPTARARSAEPARTAAAHRVPAPIAAGVAGTTTVRGPARGAAPGRPAAAATVRGARATAQADAWGCRCCRPPRSARSRRPPSCARPAPAHRAGRARRRRGYERRMRAEIERVIGLQERARPGRARARRARAQRHGAVLRRAPRRLRGHRRTAGCSPTARAARARRSCTATSARPAPITVRVGHATPSRSPTSRSRACSPAR